MRYPDIDYFTRWNSAKRVIEPTAWKRAMTSGWLGYDPNKTNGALAVPAAGTIATFFRQPLWSQGGGAADLQSPFEARNLVFADSSDTTAASLILIELLEQASQRRMMNQPIHIRNLCGTAQEPAILREPIWFESNYAVAMTAQKASGGAANLYMAFGGVPYYPWDQSEYDPEGSVTLRSNILAWRERRKYVLPFWLTTDNPNQPVVLTGNGTGTAIAKVGDDAQFEAFSICAVSTGAFTMSIQEVRSKQYLMNGQISNQAFLGTARLPTFLPVPYLIPRGSKLQFNFTDLSASGNTIYLAIAGRSIYAELKNVQDVLRDTAIQTGIEQTNLLFPKPIILGERVAR